MRGAPVLCAVLMTLGLVSAGLMAIASTHGSDGSLLPTFPSEQELRRYLSTRSSAFGEHAADAAWGKAASGTAPDRSGTNVQVQGVDESDIALTDGTYLYVAAGGTVHIVKAYPPGELRNATTIDVGDLADHARIDGLYLYQQRLIVVYGLGGHYYGMPAAEISLPLPQEQRTGVAVYEVIDPEAPVLAYTAAVSGGEVTSRMVGPCLYVVAQQHAYADDLFLPEIWSDGAQSKIPASGIHYDPSSPDASSFINLLSVDVSGQEANCTSVLCGHSSVVYMSPTSLYLTMQKGDGHLNDRPMTTIYRIAVDGLDMTVAARGEVEGWPINQFSLDESGPYLRVATTSWSTNSWSTNGVFVLDADLRAVGSITGLAVTERIYSCRFVGDTLYMVTFRQTDPLFVIDLSDANAPRVLGQVELPGVSTYLQMVEGHLLGIGFDGGSVKVSLFNVSDPLRPRELATYRIGGLSYSAAQYDHRAVLYDERYHLLTIPVTVHPGVLGTAAVDAQGAYLEPRSSAYVLKVESEGMTVQGIVDHDTLVYRSLYIGDCLYTISATTVKVNRLPDLSPVGSLVYSEDLEDRPLYAW